MVGGAGRGPPGVEEGVRRDEVVRVRQAAERRSRHWEKRAAKECAVVRMNEEVRLASAPKCCVKCQPSAKNGTREIYVNVMSCSTWHVCCAMLGIPE